MCNWISHLSKHQAQSKTPKLDIDIQTWAIHAHLFSR